MSGLVTAVYVLSIASLGVFAGANLTEGFVLVPYWRSLDAVEFYRCYAANDERLLRFFAPVTAVAALSTVAAAIAFSSTLARGSWFVLASALLSAVCVAMFPLYFARVNATFSAASIPSDRLPAELARWARWHHVRTAVALAALGCDLVPILS